MKHFLLHKKLFVLLISLFTSYTLSSQIYNGNLTLSSQAEVDAFNYTEITGNLYISESDITDLTPMNSLTSVGGHLEITRNVSLTSLSGLNNITSVGGHLEISLNSMTSLSGLDNLTYVGDFLHIWANTSLTGFCGLYPLLSTGGLTGDYDVYENAVNPTQQVIIDNGPCGQNLYEGDLTLSSQAEVEAFNYTKVSGNLTISGADITNLNQLSVLKNVGGALFIINNNLLNNLSGLQNLTSLGVASMDYSYYRRSLMIIDNGSLVNLDGLEGLSLIDDGVEISGNRSLTNINGLQNVAGIGSILKIESNNSLVNLTGLQNLTSLRGAFIIEKNASLINFDGLQNLTSVGTTSDDGDNIMSFYIKNNGSLTSLFGLENLTTVRGDLQITDNNSLASLDRLQNLSSVGSIEEYYLPPSSLYIYNNASLTNLNGLEKITTLDGSVSIQSNASLINIGGLKNINQLGSSLYISDNPLLTDLNGLENITLIQDRLIISNNDLLNNIDGLQNLTFVLSALDISENDELNNLNGLKKLTSVGTDGGMGDYKYLRISGNEALLNLDGLQNLNYIGENLMILSNISLHSFCGLYKLISDGGLNGAYQVGNNSINPTQQEIIDGGPCNSIGNTVLYGSSATLGNRLAMPVTFTEAGSIQSITIYHNGGTGNVLLGVYSNAATAPATRLGVTASTVINVSAGWQTVPLISPVSVTSGQTVWLSFVFQTNPGIRYIAGTPARALSTATWSGGMPATFGTATFANFKYSLYCTYTTGAASSSLAATTDLPKSAEIAKGITPDVELADLKVYPNPFSDKLNFEFVSANDAHAVLEIHNMLGQSIVRLMDQQVEGGVMNRIEYTPNKIISGVFIYKLTLDGKNTVGKVIYKKE